MKTTLVLLVAASLLVSASNGAGDPASRCLATKLRVAAVKSSAKLKCHARAALRSAPVDPACLTKAEEKFSAAWARIVAAGGCFSFNDEDEVELAVDAGVTGVVTALGSCGEVGGVCGGACPDGMNCFVLVRCDGTPELCRCHSSTTTCPPPPTTSTTLP
jgi:hypothetical protein